MGSVNDTIKYAATVSATFLILFESYAKRNLLCELTAFSRRFQHDIKGFLKQKELDYCNRKFWRSYKIRFFSFSIFYVVSEVILIPIYWFNDYYRSSIFFLIGTDIFICICRYRHLQHILYMNLVRHQLKLIARVLRSGTMTEAKLRSLQELFCISATMVKLQNNFFGISQSMNLIFNHLQLLGDAYWTYWRYLNGCCSPGTISKRSYFILEVGWRVLNT